MILGTSRSVENVPIRLTDERWEHILDDHPYMSGYLEAVLDAVADPEYILRGQRGALIAVVALGKKTFLHVIYRELGKKDGFIISAFTDSEFDRDKILWRADER